MKKIILLAAAFGISLVSTPQVNAQETLQSKISQIQKELDTWQAIQDKIEQQMAKDPLSPISSATAAALAKAKSQEDAQAIIKQRQDQLNTKPFTVNGQQYPYKQVAAKIEELNNKVNQIANIPSTAPTEPKFMGLKAAQ